MYHVYHMASITVNVFISVYLEVINLNVVNICYSPTSHNSTLPTSDLIKVT